MKNILALQSKLKCLSNYSWSISSARDFQCCYLKAMGVSMNRLHSRNITSTHERGWHQNRARKGTSGLLVFWRCPRTPGSPWSPGRAGGHCWRSSWWGRTAPGAGTSSPPRPRAASGSSCGSGGWSSRKPAGRWQSTAPLPLWSQSCTPHHTVALWAKKSFLELSLWSLTSDLSGHTTRAGVTEIELKII